MNKDNAAQYLPLVQALAEGKTIQLYFHDVGWVDWPGPDFTEHPDMYRIKPEPLVRWVVKGNDSEYNYQYKEAAIAKAECLSKHHNCEYTVHKMVEEL